MSKISLLFNRLCKRKFISSLLLTVIAISTSQIALADYKPPPKEDICQSDKKETCEQTTKNTVGITSRGGCSAREETFLTALAPQNHIGRTIVTRPTWAWFIPDKKPYQLKFQLYEYGVNGELTAIWQHNLISESGIMTLTLPVERPELSVGKQYRWKVILLCNPNRPSNSIVVEADLKVVSLPQSLQTELARATESLAIADVYAEQSIWYDALAQAILTTQNSTESRFELKLLEDLARIEEATDSQHNLEDYIKQSYRLRQIIEAELEKSSLSFYKQKI